ncbi:MAG: hypothetical protein NUW22_08255, partial [Acidobacteria bacterium]|nr:hypothetical protein [Acidobacteriota bacterium]
AVSGRYRIVSTNTTVTAQQQSEIDYVTRLLASELDWDTETVTVPTAAEARETIRVLTALWEAARHC